ncbi:MAG: 23S rRNA (adenine(2503)-C(2))-methyltransferase RlmN [Bacteroidetes bacterium]|nr:23S rRNA (adenine(2503)-C(2))-methyltransferase RlmN [Bacteroidota bacterium]
MNGDIKEDIRSLSLTDLEKFFADQNEKTFRANQVYEWFWKKSCRSINDMTNLSKPVRKILEDHFSFPVLHIEKEYISRDRTVKSTFRLHDRLMIEGVLIPDGNRTTACISSQVGCQLGCTFCATGLFGFKRNLAFTEIFDQVVELTNQSLHHFNVPLSNIVLMGMGEPLLNYEEVKRAILMITSEDGLGMSPQRITLSTVGIPNMIRKLADDHLRIHLAISLHTADNVKRSIIVPLNKKYPLEELRDALKYYHEKTGKRFTLEYLMFANMNDSLSDAHNLAEFCKSFPVKINLIGYNQVPDLDFKRPESGKIIAFKEFLEKKNMIVNIRKSRGEDIEAACGQLALKDRNQREG